MPGHSRFSSKCIASYGMFFLRGRVSFENCVAYYRWWADCVDSALEWPPLMIDVLGLDKSLQRFNTTGFLFFGAIFWIGLWSNAHNILEKMLRAAL
jgi:hypothetical protein